MDESLNIIKESTISKEDHFLATERLKKEFDSVKEALHNYYSLNKHGGKKEKRIDLWVGHNNVENDDHNRDPARYGDAQEALFQDLSADSLT